MSKHERRNLSHAILSGAYRSGSGSFLEFLSTRSWIQAYLHHAGSRGQPALVHLRWVKYADLLIARAREGQEIAGPKGMGVALNFNLFEQFDGDMDAFAKHARENGANVTGPVDQPWNVREVTVHDPDGYRLVFTVPININLGFDEMIDRVKKE